MKTERLDEPIEEFGEQHTEQVETVSWTATNADAAIQPGQFRDFGISVGVPTNAEEGDVLEFPAIQTYDSGEVVHWIGPADADEPAAMVTLTEAEEEGHAAATDGPEAEDAAAAEDVTEDGDANGLAIAALVVGGLGLAAGGTSLARGRK